MATITLGTSGNDFLYGDVDSADLDDYIQGLDGDDAIFGVSGNNILDDGNTGNDQLRGGAGDDVLYAYWSSGASTDRKSVV